MSRHPNGADETSSASGGPLNNPLTDNEEIEKKHESLGPLQQTDSGDAANPAGQESSPDNLATTADPHTAATTASGALGDDHNHPAAGTSSSSTAPVRIRSGKRQLDSDEEKYSTTISATNAATASSSSSSISPKGSSNIDDEDDDGTDQEVPVSSNNDNSNVTWKPQELQSVCEFTHTITDYSQKRDSGCKKAEYSDITVDDRGNKWRLIVYVNGNGRASNHHLSLFLQVRATQQLSFFLLFACESCQTRYCPQCIDSSSTFPTFSSSFTAFVDCTCHFALLLFFIKCRF